MCRHHAITALLACAALAAGCGDDDESESERPGKGVSIAQRHAQLGVHSRTELARRLGHPRSSHSSGA
jgi:hypothetical protein